MEKNLAVPLAMAQIEAANELHEQLTGWQVTYSALRTVRLTCALSWV